MLDEAAAKTFSLNKIAQEVAKNYITSVLFVDDCITYDDAVSSNFIIAPQLIEALASNDINASMYRWTKENQQATVCRMIKNNDVCVLDWKISIQHEYDEKNLDEDVEGDGDRGKYAKCIINNILNDDSIGPKLIFIYTDEPQEVQPYLKTLQTSFGGSSDSDGFSWLSANGMTRICLYFKDEVHGIPQERIITYEALAEKIIYEFSVLHEGILPITLLRVLASIRKNTCILLEKYSKRLDSAFVIHRALCPEPIDADNLLLKTITDTFAALLSYKNKSLLTPFDLVAAWIDEQIYAGNEIVIKKCNISINNEQRRLWQQNGYTSFLSAEYSKRKQENEISQIGKDISSFDRSGNLLKGVSSCFSPKEFSEQEIASINADFAIITHHKSLFAPVDYTPHLSLGCIIKKCEGNCTPNFFLCIQQSCDCLRIEKAEKRKFIFLPLEQKISSFDIVIPDDRPGSHVFLAVCNKVSHNIVTINFMPQEGDSVIKAKKEGNEFIFVDSELKKYHWVCDLKETHALKFVNEYAQKLTRVGIDESEWLRRFK